MSWGTIIAAAATAGVAVGAAGRVLLARLRRGVRLRRGPCELLAALLFAAVAARWASGGLPAWWLPVPLALSAVGVPLAAVDLTRRRLPDALTLPAYGLLGAAVIAAAAGASDQALVLAAVLGGGMFFGVHLLVRLAAPRALGAGDVKLAGSLGGVLGAVGWPALAVSACLASLFTLVLAGLGRLGRAGGWGSGVPHGPGLLAATWLVVVFPGTGSGVGPLG